ncbi:MAG: GxxExxY protein [Deltaproteobacteria bacterium]
MNISDDLIHRELSEQIIGAAMKVLNTLGPGMNEKIYENALVIELTNLGLKVDQQDEFVVRYLGREVGKLKPDLIVEKKVIVDTKVVEGFVDDHTAKMISYLAITNLQLALLINFKFARLRWKRVVRSGAPAERGEPGEQK